MAATKECKTCGAQNDVIFTNCMYCKASLPQTDMNSLSNDELVMACGEWIGKLDGIDMVHGIKIESKREATGLHKLLGEASYNFITYQEVVGNAEKYLQLLEVRASNNPTLQVSLQGLKYKFDGLRQGAKTKDKKSKAYTLIGVGIMFLLVIGILGYMVHNESKDADVETNRLSGIELKIDDAIKEKNYDYALILTNQLSWNIQRSGEQDTAMRNEYDKKRNEYTKTISELKTSTKTQ